MTRRKNPPIKAYRQAGNRHWSALLPSVVWAIAFIVATPAADLFAQEPDVSGWDRTAMAAEMQRLAEICERLNLSDEAELCRRWLPLELPHRRVIYLPEPFPTSDPRDRNQSLWCNYFITARKRYAEHLFAQAQQAVQRNDEAAAFRLLWHVLRENPEHEQADKILGSLATSVTVRPRIRSSSSDHPDFGWPGSEYNRIQTPHFMLTTRAGTKESLQLAEQLEELYAIWNQLFYPLWAAPGRLKARFSGNSAAWSQTRRMEVVLLADRADYLQTLGVAEDNIGVSVGYYTPQAKVSFFYPDPDIEETLFHELTHQLFMESSAIQPDSDAGTRSGIWIIEGVALYMESLERRQGYWTIGGTTPERLQTARYRAIRDGYWPAWNEFVTGGSEQWKSDPNIALLYAHAAGLTHFFMDYTADVEQSRREYLKALTSVYQNNAEFSGLEAFLDNFASAKQEETYQTALTVTTDQVDALLADSEQGGAKPKSLVLAGSQFTPEVWNNATRLSSLEWLDMSFSNVTNPGLEKLANLKQLNRLSVEGTTVNGTILTAVAELPELQELDLTGCPVDDNALAALKNHPSLETLWLGKTQVTDAALTTLEALSQLKFCDVSDTKITPNAWQSFLAKNPKVRSPGNL